MNIISDPNLWGKHFWYTMEAIACTMNQEKKEHVEKVLNELQYLLPCEKCKNHYREYMKENPVSNHLENPIHLLRWMHKLKCNIKYRQDKTCPIFEDYLDYVVDYFDTPEIYYYLDKEREMEKLKNLVEFDLKKINIFELLGNQYKKY